MTFLLNYLPTLIIVLAVALAYYQWKSNKSNAGALALRFTAIIIATVIILSALNALTAGVIPKNVPAKLAVPEFVEPEAKSDEIRDIQRKPPMNAEQSKEHFDDMVDWRKAKAEREAAKEESK